MRARAASIQSREGSSARGALQAVSRFTWRRPRLVTLGQVSAPVAAFLLVYVAALVALLIQSLWTSDAFTGEIVHSWTLDNFREIADDPYPTIIRRTVFIASAVTVTCMLLAFPYAYFLVRIASRRLRIVLLVATVLPLWVSYLVRVYSWRLILNPDGALNWWLNKLGLPDQNIAYTNWAMWLVFTYIWFPFMVLPVYAALERVPYSFIEASADLGAKPITTFLRVTLPLSVPGIVAGSLLVFIPAVGEYVIPSLLGRTDQLMIGRVLSDEFFANRDCPVASAVAICMLVLLIVPIMLFQHFQSRALEKRA